MLNEVYVDVVELKHYLGLVGVIIDIFNKYTKEENVEDIFKWDYVINTEVSFLKVIIKKWSDAEVEISGFPEILICKCFDVILDNYIYYRGIQDHEEHWKYESLNKGFLIQLEKKFSLRANYIDYLAKMKEKQVDNIMFLGFDESCKYIEKLYGYKNYVQLCKFITDRYKDAEINIKGSTLRISFETNPIGQFYRPDVDVLREISNYSMHVSKISSVLITINNTNTMTDKIVVTVLKHSISMGYHQWNYTETRSNGMVYRSKSQYYSF